jgi:hypothetical protein
MDIQPKLVTYLQRMAPDASYGHPGYWGNVRLEAAWPSETVEALAQSFVDDPSSSRCGWEPGWPHRKGMSSLRL